MGLEDTGKSIASLRKKAGLTQKQLADYLGISDKAVSKWERGITFPDISFLEQLSTILDTDTDSLLAGAPAHSEKWTGILVLDDDSVSNAPQIDTVIYDKPMICYLLSCFMLAGIRSINVYCSEREKAFIADRFGSGEAFGISLACHAEKNIRFPETSIMLMHGRTMLYGRGLTRCLKLAMTKRNQFTVLSIMKKNADDFRRIDFDPTTRVTRIGHCRHKKNSQAHYYIPLLFIPQNMAGEFQGMYHSFDAALSDLAGQNLLCTETLDRGFLEFSLDTWETVSDASNFVRLVQESSGMLLCSLEEIAYRRGFISEYTSQK